MISQDDIYITRSNKLWGHLDGPNESRKRLSMDVPGVVDTFRDELWTGGAFRDILWSGVYRFVCVGEPWALWTETRTSSDNPLQRTQCRGIVGWWKQHLPKAFST